MNDPRDQRRPWAPPPPPAEPIEVFTADRVRVGYDRHGRLSLTRCIDAAWLLEQRPEQPAPRPPSTSHRRHAATIPADLDTGDGRYRRRRKAAA